MKYDFAPELDGATSHAFQFHAVRPGSRVLELGCATGFLSRALAAKGCTVTGVELDPEAARQARAHCERVLVGNLDQLDLATLEGPFDAVVCGDVLEHLVDPGRVLRALHPLLAPDGTVVATLPNVAHGDLRLALLSGVFDYHPLGLLDETHLRFFTHKTLHALFAGAGYVIERLERLPAPLFGTELGVQPGLYPPEVLAYVQADPEALTYQFALVARPGEAPPFEEAERRPAFLAAAQAVGEARLQEALAPMQAAHEQALAEGARVLEALRQEAERERERLAGELAAARAAVLAAEEQASHLRERFDELEARFRRLRRLSYVNPLAVADALLRRARKTP